jgi:hypothetical protein
MSEANKIAMRVVLDYINELESTPCFWDYWTSAYFAQRSYAKTAARDILELLENSSEPPLVVIETYRDKMDEYACLNEVNSFIFSVAYDTAENIIDAIISSCY